MVDGWVSGGWVDQSFFIYVVTQGGSKKKVVTHKLIVKILNLFTYFHVLICITSLRYLSITCNAFLSCYIMYHNLQY